MRRARRQPTRVAAPPASPVPSGERLVRTAGSAVTVAALVTLIGSASAFWLCLPAVLLAAGSSRSRGVTAAETVLLAAAGFLPLVCLGIQPLPSPALAAVVVASAAAIVTALRERAERERDALRGAALSDPLTGLPNRRVLVSRCDYEISRHVRERRSFAVVMLDLDGFKLLNDRFGHAAGDELLCDVAAALTEAVRAQDTVARLGGDEFCILAPETDAEGATALLHRVDAAVGGATAGVEGLSASLGVAFFPVDARTSATLIDLADQHLLDAKRARYRRRTHRRRAA